MLNLLTSLPLVRLLRQGSKRFNFEMMAFIVFAGLTNAGLLAVVNAAAENARNEGANGRLLSLFAVTIGLYIFAQRHILFTMITEVERILSGIRIRIADRIRKADLEAFERIGRSEVYGIVARETQNISQAAGTLILAAQSIMLLVFTFGYLAILSRTAFVITLCVTGIGVMLHFRRAGELNGLLREAQRKENDFLTALTHLLDGFKEARMSRLRSADLFHSIRDISTAVEDVKTRTEHELRRALHPDAGRVLRPAGGHRLPAAAGEPRVLRGGAETDGGRPVHHRPAHQHPERDAGVLARPTCRRRTSSRSRRRWRSRARADQNGRPEATPPAGFSRIELKHMQFQYQEAGRGGAFHLGPLDLTIDAGQMVFIIGGNGSGKSTLLKTLTGLYHPQAGAIVMDDTLLSPETAAWYRSHFTVVFSDYHLFDRLYGFQDVPPERVRDLLKLMQIEDKTAFENGRFTDLDLSSGQRKRLALVAALHRGPADSRARRVGRRSGPAVPQVFLRADPGGPEGTGKNDHRGDARRQVLRPGRSPREDGVRSVRAVPGRVMR